MTIMRISAEPGSSCPAVIHDAQVRPARFSRIRFDQLMH
jgi:hypothetical protein